MNFDPSDLSVGELVDLTDVAGEDAIRNLAAGKVNPKVLLGLVWILGRRDNPEYTLEEARSVKVVDVKFPGPAVLEAVAT